MKKPLHILTVDFEDWFHILDHGETRYPEQWNQFESRLEQNVEQLLSLFDKHNVRATWFCLGWSAERFPSLVRRVAANHQIACHTYSHQLLYQQSPSEFIQDTTRAKKILEDIIGGPVDAFRAAGFSVTQKTPWFFEALHNCGFTVDSSVFAASRNHGGFSEFGQYTPCYVKTDSGTLLELPVSPWKKYGLKVPFSGGGYFRLLPYSFLSTAYNRADYSMTYFHPRDIDAYQPVLPSLPLRRKLMSYYGLKGCFPKLDKLLTDFDFVSVDTAVAQLQLQQLTVVEFSPTVPLNNFVD